jgi:hypothetical protein
MCGTCDNDSSNDCAQDCNGDWGGSAELDECGECGGDGIDEGACDCDGNVEDCAGECGGSAELDECGECGGSGPVEGYDCDGSPIEFTSNSSQQQAFYFFESFTIDGQAAEFDDWIGAFNGDICVGARKWDTSECGGGICEVTAGGYDGTEYTIGYMMHGNIPTFKIYDTSEDIYYDAVVTGDITDIDGNIVSGAS